MWTGWNVFLLVSVASLACSARPPRGRILPRLPTGENAVPLNMSSWVGKSVMMISAHPDDIEGCAGATVYLLRQLSINVYYTIVTNGDKGCSAAFCLNWTSEQIAVARQGEAVSAAAVVGVPPENVILLDYEDGMVPSYNEVQIRTDLIAVLRRVQPDIVMTWYPYAQLSLMPSAGWDDMGYHPDHQGVGKIALDAQYQAGDPYIFPQIGSRYGGPSEFYTWEFILPTHYIDMSDDSVFNMKVASYLAHKSQVSDPSGMTEWLNALGENVAAVTHGFNGTRAEGFHAYF